MATSYISKITLPNNSEYKLKADNTWNGITGSNINCYAECSTAAATVAKEATVLNGTFSLEKGATVFVKFAETNSASSPTLNINNTGAKALKIYGTTAVGTGQNTNGWRAGAIVPFIYDGTNWLRMFWENSTYYTDSVDCATGASTAAKVGTISYWTNNSSTAMPAGMTFQFMMVYTNTATSPTLNIGSTGAKSVYINGVAANASNWIRGMYTGYWDGTSYYLRNNGLAGHLIGTGLTRSGETINHSNSITAGTAGTSSATSGSTLAVPYITYDAQGHITGKGTHTHTVTGFLTSSSDLDATKLTGIVPTDCLPSYVDDVLEYASLSNFPATGESGKIYIAIDTGKTYRWSGTTYTVISETLALGETSSTAYRGDRGKTAYDHSQLTSGNPHNVTASDVGLGNVENIKLSTWTGSTNITKLGTIATGTVPLANVSNADDLKKIEALTGTSGLLKKTAANTWALDTTAYTTNTGTVTSVGVSASGALSVSGSPITSSGTITVSHSTATGYKHIPSGGSSGQFLKWSADGTATWAADNDTKNTAGSTDSDSKLFLVGATSQAANPQTYSDANVYTTNGTLRASKMNILDKVTLQWNDTTQALDFVFA